MRKEVNWRDWMYTPPQIGNSLIGIWRDEWDRIYIIRRCDIDPSANVAGLQWYATGIYRERFYRDTGKWI